MDWFKMWGEARSDEKLSVFTDAQHRTWFRALCYASEQETRGTIPSTTERVLAVKVAGGDVELLRSTVALMVELEMVRIEEDGAIAFLNFDKRNRKPSEMPKAQAERKQRSRAKGGESHPGHTHVTPPSHHTDTDLDTETDTTTPLPPKGVRGPVGDPLMGKLSADNLFDGEFEILEGAFLSRKISAFWQLQGEKRQDITDWLDASKDTRKTAFDWALGESWAQNPYRAALDAVRFPNKYPTYPGSKVVQMRGGDAGKPAGPAFDGRPVPADVAGMPWEPMYRKLKWGEGMEAKDWQVAAVAAGRAGLSSSEAQRINREEGIGAALRWILGNDQGAASGIAHG